MATPNTLRTLNSGFLPQTRGEFSKGVERGILSLREAGRGVAGGVAGALGADEFSDEQLAAADALRQQAAAPELQARVNTLEDVGSLRDLGDLVASGAGSTVPIGAATALGGVGGRVLGGLRGAGNLSKQAGTVVGAAVPLETQAVGSLFQDIRTDPEASGTQQEQFEGALLGGTGQAATNLLPFGAAGKVLGAPGRTLRGRVGRGAATGAIAEGGQEVAEGVIGDVTRQQFNSEVDPLDLNARATEFFLGSTIGGGLGAVGGAVTPSSAGATPSPQQDVVAPPVVAGENLQVQQELDLNVPTQPPIQGRLAKRMEAIRTGGTSRDVDTEAFDLFDKLPDQETRTRVNREALQAAAAEAAGNPLTADQQELKSLVFSELGGKDFWQELRTGSADTLDGFGDQGTVNPFTGETDTEFQSIRTLGGESDVLTNAQGRPWKFNAEFGSQAAENAAAQFEGATVVPYREMFDNENEFRADAERLGIENPDSFVVVSRPKIPAALRGADELAIGQAQVKQELTTEQKRTNALANRASNEILATLSPEAQAKLKDVMGDVKEAKTTAERIVLPVQTNQQGQMPKGHVPVTVGGKPQMLNLFNLRSQVRKAVPLDPDKTLTQNVGEQLAAGLASIQTSTDLDAQVDVDSIPDNTVVSSGERGTVTWGQVKKQLAPRFISPKPAGTPGDIGQFDPREGVQEAVGEEDLAARGLELPTDAPSVAAELTKGIQLTREERAEPLIQRAVTAEIKEKPFNKQGLRRVLPSVFEIQTENEAVVPVVQKRGNIWSLFDDANDAPLLNGKTFPNRNAAVKAFRDSEIKPEGSAAKLAEVSVADLTPAEKRAFGLERDVAPGTEGVELGEATQEEFEAAQQEAPKPEGPDLSSLNKRKQADMKRRLEVEATNKGLQRLRDRLEKTGNEWAKKLGVTGEVKLIDTAEYIRRKEARHGKNWGEVDPRATALGTVFGSDGAIYLSPTMTQREQIEVLGHEIGHKVEHQLFRKLPEKGQQEIRDAYDNWFNENFGIDKKLSDLLKSRLPFFAGEALTDSDVKIGGLKGQDVIYFAKFDEWFADQTARWLTTDAKPRGTVEKFFSDVAEKIRELFGLVAGKAAPPDAEVAQWLNSRFESDVTRRERPEGPGPREKITPSEVNKDALGKVAKKVKKSPEVVKAANQVNQNPQSEATNTTVADAVKGAGAPPGGKPPSSGGAGRSDPEALLTADEKNILQRAFTSNFSLRQLRSKLAGDPQALEEIDSDPAKAAAYGFQFWMSGDFKVGPNTDTVLKKILKTLQDILGVIDTSGQARQILKARADGTLARRSQGKADFSVQKRVNKTQLQRASRHVESLGQWVGPMIGAVAANTSERVHNLGNAQLSQIMNDLYTPVTREGGKESFAAAKIRQRATFEKRMRSIFDGKDKAFGQAMIDVMNGVRKAKTSQEKQAEKKLRKLLRNIYFYSQDAGMDFQQREKYFPRVADIEALQNNKEAFTNMLLQAKYKGNVNGKKGAEEIYQAYVRNFGDAQSAADELKGQIDRGELDQAELGVAAPAAGSSKKREFDWISDEDMSPFLSKDLGLTMSKYIDTMVKRSEYIRKFDGDNSIEARFARARSLGASEKDIETTRQAVRAMLGRQERDIDPRIQKAQGYVMVAQNWSILALATLSSLMDPVGMAIRGDMDSAWVGFKAGIDEIKNVMKNDLNDTDFTTELRELADIVGITEVKGTNEALGSEFGGYHLTGRAAKWNEALFKFNGLQDWTQGTRIMALAAAQNFIVKHSDFGYSKDSKRFFEQLGLREGDIDIHFGPIGVDRNSDIKTGRKLRTLKEEEVFALEDAIDAETDLKKKDTLSDQLEKDQRVKAALNRWVDEAILRPNAATRPIWGSDPRFMLIFHMKSFTFAFQERILKRIASEAFEGNWKPALFTGGLLPVMFAADYMRDVLQGDDDERKDTTFVEALDHTAQRAGLYGIAQFGRDALQAENFGGSALTDLLGPTVQQTSAFAGDLLTGRSVDDDFIRALPAQNWWKKWDFLQDIPEAKEAP